jgi:hypothetical protein
MNRAKIATVLGIIVSVASALLGFSDLIGPVAALAFSVVGLAASAAGAALQRSPGSPLVTVLAVLVGVAGAIAPKLAEVNEWWGQIALLVAGVVAAFGRGLFGGGSGGGDDGELPPPGASRFVQRGFALLLIPALALSQIACPFKAKTPGAAKPKPSETVRVAQAFAFGPVAFNTGGEILSILVEDKQLSPEDGRLGYRAVGIAGDVLDKVRPRIQSGQWDQGEVVKIVDDGLADFDALEREGKLGARNPRVREWFDLGRAVLETVKALRPPRSPNLKTIEADSTRPALADDQAETAFTSTLTRIIAVSTPAAIKWVQYRQETDIGVLWEAAERESKALAEANARRLAAAD